MRRIAGLNRLLVNGSGSDDCLRKMNEMPGFFCVATYSMLLSGAKTPERHVSLLTSIVFETAEERT